MFPVGPDETTLTILLADAKCTIETAFCLCALAGNEHCFVIVRVTRTAVDTQRMPENTREVARKQGKL